MEFLHGSYIVTRKFCSCKQRSIGWTVSFEKAKDGSEDRGRPYLTIYCRICHLSSDVPNNQWLMSVVFMDDRALDSEEQKQAAQQVKNFLSGLFNGSPASSDQGKP